MHLHRFLEVLHDLGIAESRLLENAVALAVTDCSIDECLLAGAGKLLLVVRVGVLGATTFTQEGRLQGLAHVLVNSLFGILLHARVDGGVNLQTIGVDVIM